MKFLVDAQLPPSLADHLRAAGHDADHVNRIGLGAARDEIILDHATKTNAVIVTKDADFFTLAHGSRKPPQIVWIRLGNITNKGIRSVIDRVLLEMVSALEGGEAIVEIR